MLNGMDPLLVIVIKKRPPEDLVGPPLPSSLFDAIGIPIPIYLAERPLAALGAAAPSGAVGRALAQAGIYVDSETRSIDIQTDVEAITSPDPLTGDTATPLVTQNPIDTQVTVNLIASRDSVIITALITIMEFLIARMRSREYSIHYINKSTVIFGGLLHRFATSINPNEDKIAIEMVISTAAKTSPITKAGPPSIPDTSTSSLSSPPPAGS